MISYFFSLHSEDLIIERLTFHLLLKELEIFIIRGVAYAASADRAPNKDEAHRLAKLYAEISRKVKGHSVHR